MQKKMKKRSRIMSNIYSELYSLKDYEDNKSLFFESLKQNKNRDNHYAT